MAQDPTGRGEQGSPSSQGAFRTIVTDAPTPSERSRAVLVVVSGHDVGRVISLSESTATLGRSEECSVRLSDESLSRVHAQVVRVAGNWMLADKGSTNGSYLNDQRVERPSRLSDGDRIRLGASTTLRFSLVDEVEENALRRVYEAAIRDALTGVANRKHLEERLASELAFALRHGTPLSVLIMDVDHFKRINDSFGHLAGDAVLRGVAGVLARGIRTEDLLARYGGEEFVVLARGIGVAEAAAMGERLRSLLASNVVTFEGREIRVTSSGGVASLACCGEKRDRATLLGLADSRLYQAKQTGRNRIVWG
jgi:two-component system, cell cycle response regulator